MLSLQQALEIKESILSYLQATFTFRKKNVAQAFDEFLNDPQHGMFKGPYIGLKLPFIKASKEELESVPLDIKPDWTPYDHQIKSWNRLSTHNQNPKPTLVTTGTGSGKTESFLYPILDYCYKEMHRPGVKVIIMYPMNALATDQAKRLAEAIYEDERLTGRIKAGLFIGEGKNKSGKYPKTMGESHIIEDRETILDTSPDIILTNFKMLDYALMKHNYHHLWKFNLEDPTLLQFLVLDELHTYDGAQGTDVANLIRRLKLKLNLPSHHLCPVGTSATIGSGEDAPQLLADYASKVFGENIEAEAVITENRIPIDIFFQSDDELESFIPRTSKLSEMEFNETDDLSDYLDTLLELWQIDKENISNGLLKLKMVKDLVEICGESKGLELYSVIISKLNVRNPDFRKIPEWNPDLKISPKEKIVETLLTLISYAKEKGSKGLPFLYLQTQFWIRELSGVQYTLEEIPKFTFRDQVEMRENTALEISALPPWYCRECNSSGWLGVKNDNSNRFSKDIKEIYDKYFSNHKNVYFLLPKDELKPEDLEISGYRPEDKNFKLRINPYSLEIMEADEEGGIEMQAFRKHENDKSVHHCPCCNSLNTVAIIGTKIPTLSSIAVSQTLATDLDITAEKDRKILAFTNSVQDAAHQAGFIEARNYRFTFRSSVQKIINHMDRPISLDKLYEEFLNYWKENADESGSDKLSGYLYRFFPKDYIGKSSPADYVTRNGYSEEFLKEFDLRIQWELYAEFGFNSLIGRTLEKMGASSVYFDRNRLEEAWNSMEDWLNANDNNQSIKKEDWLKFTNLILHRSRSRGAVQHPYLAKYREHKFDIWDLNWGRDNRHFLNPNYDPKKSRFPKILTDGDSQNNLLDSTQTKGTNWFHHYFIKSFIWANSNRDFINEFYIEWLKALVKAEVLDEVSNSKQKSYTLLASAIWVKKNINNYHCNKCESKLYLNSEDDLVEQGKCLAYRCTGDYEKEEAVPTNYYKAIYNRKRAPRIYAEEHTGLLAREDREALEFDFKKRPNFNSPNALVATSTLEMGIDIGDLNTAYNNSVPPLPSNFLQRVGRAGRKTGDALIVNFAKQQNHDLFYFTDPKWMMQGQVNTPGCYLEAKDILRRHFTAFCIDSWTSENPNENTIPNFIKDLKLGKRDLTDSNFFINRLNNFIKRNKENLVHSFLVHYSEQIKNESFSEIKSDLDSEEFYSRLLRVFERVKEELNNIDDLRKQIDKEQKESGLTSKDPKYIEMDNEKRNLSGIRKSIGKRNILEHLTNVGILPNYAFPETGVTLHATILPNQGEKATTPKTIKEYELVRSASQAIKEFAPENYFYTQKHRFEIKGLNVFDWGDKENFHEKRFCSRCDHMELEILAKKGNCPKCGDPSWNSASNVHLFARLTSVKSINNERNTSLSDSNDDRDSIKYQQMHHISIDNRTSEGAWILKDIPFGIEYVKSAEITRVNYGRNDVIDARKNPINDQEVMTKGFVTCRHCGKSSSLINKKDHQFHFGYCKHKNSVYANKSDDVFKEVFLFRSFSTEILKIVLPIQEFNTEADIAMFRAGLELGLKEYFKGNPDHIHLLAYKEYNQKTDKFNRFLVMYDTIPGGTGYLQRLFDHKEFSRLLNETYEAIKDCSCQHEDKDGCYQCIYSYGNQFNRKDLSRERAEKWFKSILEKTEEWEHLQEGLSSVTNNGKIEESELEERFIKLLEIWAQKNKGFRFTPIRKDGILEYKLDIEQETKEGLIEASYWIRPQITLGPKDGIAYQTRTDFLIVCEQYKINEENLTEEVKKIAVYLDGYHFHASAEHNVFKKDIQKRIEITKNQEFKTWTLTWKNLDAFEALINGSQNEKDELAFWFEDKAKVNYNKLLNLIKTNYKPNYSTALLNMLRLLDQLKQPVNLPKHEKSWYFYLASRTEKILAPSFNPNNLQELILGKLEYDNYLSANKIEDFNFLVPAEQIPNFNFLEWKIWVNIGQKRIFNLMDFKHFDTIEKEEWETFWLFFNIFQSEDFIDYDEFDDLQNFKEENSELINRLKELYEDNYHEFMEKAVANSLITTENESSINSLTDEKGNIIAEAEFVFSELKIAIEPFDEQNQKVFKKYGFKIYNLENLNEIEL